MREKRLFIRLDSRLFVHVLSILALNMFSRSKAWKVIRSLSIQCRGEIPEVVQRGELVHLDDVRVLLIAFTQIRR